MNSRSTLPASAREMIEQGFTGLGGNAEQRVQELADREEIRELIARYAQQVYRRQSPADMFTEDGLLTIRMPGFATLETRGLDKLRALFADTSARPTLNMPAVHNVVIAVEGDEAVSTSWVELHLSNANDPDGKVFAGCGTYDDRLRRVNGRWKFVSREADVVIVGAVQKEAPVGR